MKYFLDTEFIENGKTIDLISIGIVSEDNRKYYACNLQCNLKKANSWVRENVFPNLPPKNLNPTEVSFNHYQSSKKWKTKKQITKEILEFTKCNYINKYEYNSFSFYDLLFKSNLNYKYEASLAENIEEPEFWGYYASYDWIVFCQLFGSMADLPKGFPMYINDLKQLHNSIDKNIELPKQNSKIHDALNDAKWNKEVYSYLSNLTSIS